MSVKDEAVRTASERLEAIEHWSRWTAIAATVAASCLAIVAASCLFAGFVYWRVTTVISEGARSFAKEMENRNAPSKPFHRGTQPPF